MTGELNIRLYEWIHAGAGHQPIVDGIAIFFAQAGPYLLGVLFIFFWFFSGERRKIALLEATEAAALGLLINQFIGLFYFHPRPYMEGMGPPLIPHGPETSFPSDHATLIFTAGFYLLKARGWAAPGILLLTLAILTAWGRVYSGVHFPLDMAGSMAVGLASAGLIRRFAARINRLNETLIQIAYRLTVRIVLRKSIGSRKD
jgi:undecaprenyl-diphosphatase